MMERREVLDAVVRDMRSRVRRKERTRGKW